GNACWSNVSEGARIPLLVRHNVITSHDNTTKLSEAITIHIKVHIALRDPNLTVSLSTDARSKTHFTCLVEVLTNKTLWCGVCVVELIVRHTLKFIFWYASSTQPANGLLLTVACKLSVFHAGCPTVNQEVLWWDNAYLNGTLGVVCTDLNVVGAIPIVSL